MCTHKRSRTLRVKWNNLHSNRNAFSYSIMDIPCMRACPSVVFFFWNNFANSCCWCLQILLQSSLTCIKMCVQSIVFVNWIIINFRRYFFVSLYRFWSFWYALALTFVSNLHYLPYSLEMFCSHSENKKWFSTIQTLLLLLLLLLCFIFNWNVPNNSHWHR